MVEKIPDCFDQLLIYEKEIPYTNVPALRPYPALIVNPEHCFDVSCEPVPCNDVIQINVRDTGGEAPVVVLFSSVVEDLFQEGKIYRVTDSFSIFVS